MKKTDSSENKGTVRKKYAKPVLAGLLMCAGVLIMPAAAGRAGFAAADGLVDDGIVAEGDGGAGETIRIMDDTAADPTQQADLSDDASLIEGGNISVKQEGVSLEEIEEAERKVREAQEEAAELLAFSVPDPDPADAAALQEYLDRLYAVDNPTGSDGELEIASYIMEVMESWGYTVQEQNFHEGFLNEDYIDVPGLNILAERGASSEYHTDRILIVAAHYDSKTKPAEDDWLANDKTGAAALMEAARVLSSLPTDMDVCFAFLSGEEDGLYGSEKLVDFLTEEQRARICGVLYVGTVGTAVDAPYLLGTDDGQPNDPGRIVRAAALGNELDGLLFGVEEETESGDSPEISAAEVLQYGYTETTPQDWSFVTDFWSGRKHFAEASLPALSLFQDVSEYYTEGTEPVIRAPLQNGAEETNGTAEADAAEDASAADDVGAVEVSGSAEAEISSRPPIDMASLQDCTDILAKTIVQYMYAETAAASGVQE